METLKEALNTVGDKEIRHIVPVSGGKDSAALAIYLKQKYPEIDPEYVFSDTDCELPETYDFLERLEALLGKAITRINALDYLQIEKKPGRRAFDIFLKEYYGGFLPSPQARWCTGVLKIKPFENYVGNSTAYSYIGIRADEDRSGYVQRKPPKLSQKQNIIPVYPFKDDGLTLYDIRRVLEGSGIGFPDYYRWRSRSGCYFCFYQQIGEWQGLMENHPNLFKKAKTYEKTAGPKKFTWVEGKTLDDLEKLEVRYTVPGMDEAEGCAICHL